MSHVLHNINAKPKIVPVVLPGSADKSISGRVRNLVIRTVPHTDWLESDGEGGWTLTKIYEKRGFLLLEDAYRAENNEAGWEKYARYLDDWLAGRTTSPFPFHLLPIEVQNRQRGLVSEDKLDPWAPAKHVTTGKLSEDEPTTPKKGK